MKIRTKLMTGVAMLSLALGGTALAGGGSKASKVGQHEDQSTQMGGSSTEGQQSWEQEPGLGGAGQQDAALLGEQELTGKVVKAERNTLYLEHMGAIVPLQVQRDTKFEGEFTRLRDVKEGQEIRASFEVKNQTKNVLKSVRSEPSFEPEPMQQPGTGGTGMPPEPYPGTPGTQPEPFPGTGGSGEFNEPGLNDQDDVLPQDPY
jgi:hypothetical protein